MGRASQKESKGLIYELKDTGKNFNLHKNFDYLGFVALSFLLIDSVLIYIPDLAVSGLG